MSADPTAEPAPTPPCPACGASCSAAYDRKTDMMLVACAHGVMARCPLPVFAAAIASVLVPE